MESISHLDKLLKQASKQLTLSDVAVPPQSVMGVAECSGPNGAYRTELQAAKGRLRFKQIREGRPPFVGVVNEDAAWRVDAEGWQALDKRAASMMMGHDFLLQPHYLCDYFSASDLAQESFLDEPCDKILTVDRWDFPSDIFLNRDKKQLYGFRLSNPYAEDERVTVQFVSWQAVGELAWPKEVHIWDKSGLFQFNFVRIELNQVDKTIFSPPTVGNSDGVLKTA